MSNPRPGFESCEAELQAVLECVRSVLRDPAFAAALVLLVATDGRNPAGVVDVVTPSEGDTSTEGEGR